MEWSLEQSMQIVRGDTKRYILTVTTGEEKTPVDIGDFVFTMTVKKSPSMTDSRAEFQVAASILDAENGKAVIELSEANTKLDLGDYYYDIQMRIPQQDNDTVKTLRRGKLKVVYEVTADE